jgi:predicted glycoside hydrolase/deacetylase ChbG (UPF0249 family)
MDPNPLMQRLGYADDDRVVIIHADDIGMCQATLPAFSDLVDFGLISSSALMVPCPWFPQVATTCRQYSPDEVDIGVHLTITCEYDNYRWSPISTRDPASGLIDEQGYFHLDSEGVQEHGVTDAIQRESEAQIARALAAGIDITHIDTHMGAVIHPKFLSGYTQLALKHRLPLMMLRLDEAGWMQLGQAMDMGTDGETAALGARLVRELEAQGVPLIDHIVMMPLDQPNDRVEQAKKMFDALPSGLTHFIIHPAYDTPELRAITPDWQSRVADYQAFTSKELRDHVQSSGVQVIGYRELQALM